MKSIHLLDSDTINKIAAGEVVERPSSVIKELVENAIDAKASAITIEIKEGGIAMMRVTDNGGGIDRDDIKTAFVRHATSKIETAMDLMTVGSLGFRGEALSSIASVSQIELITKVHRELLGVRYCIDGGEEKSCDDIGCPDGTTIIVRNLFYNTPARRKFLKTAATEAAYINDLAGRLALSHPDVSFKFINNNQNRLHTSGNGNLRDIIYQIYGRDVTGQLLEVDVQGKLCHVTGFIGKPILSRGNRSWENYFINGRYIKSNIITKAIEDAYKTFVMIHKYPFTAFHIEVDPALIDVNVHPRKMELRFNQNEAVYQEIYDIIRAVLEHRELIPAISLEDQKKANGKEKEKESGPEPFELQRLAAMGAGQKKPEQSSSAYSKSGHSVPTGFSAKSSVAAGSGYSAASYPNQGADSKPYIAPTGQSGSAFVRETPTAYHHKEMMTQSTSKLQDENNRAVMSETTEEQKKTEVTLSEAAEKAPKPHMPIVGEQMQLFGEDERLLDEKARARHRLIGQVFDTYWMVEYDGKLFIIDQHAAHERVRYDHLAERAEGIPVQEILIPYLIHVDSGDVNLLEDHRADIEKLGITFEQAGPDVIRITGSPEDLSAAEMERVMGDIVKAYHEKDVPSPETMRHRMMAYAACRGAIKRGDPLNIRQMKELIRDLFHTSRPFVCPHGRPTIVKFTPVELGRLFKRP